MSSKALVIPAAGAGRRMQHEQAKPFIKIGGQPILAHTIRAFLPLDGLSQVIVATSSEYVALAEAILEETVQERCPWMVVEGGAERQHSVHKALQQVKNCELVLVHDAVRPFVTLRQIQHCCRQAEKHGAAILGIPSKDTIKMVDEQEYVTETPDRKFLWQVQTPQVFKTNVLKKAHQKAGDQDYFGTDDASLVEWLGQPVKMVKGSSRNIKLTYPQDLKMARMLLKEEQDQ